MKMHDIIDNNYIDLLVELTNKNIVIPYEDDELNREVREISYNLFIKVDIDIDEGIFMGINAGEGIEEYKIPIAKITGSYISPIKGIDGESRDIIDDMDGIDELYYEAAQVIIEAEKRSITSSRLPFFIIEKIERRNGGDFCFFYENIDDMNDFILKETPRILRNIFMKDDIFSVVFTECMYNEFENIDSDIFIIDDIIHGTNPLYTVSDYKNIAPKVTWYIYNDSSPYDIKIYDNNFNIKEPKNEWQRYFKN